MYLSPTKEYTVLAVEPNRDLAIPYMYLPLNYKLKCVSTVPQALSRLAEKHPDLVLISASLSYDESFKILWYLKDISKETFIPVIYVVDWSQEQPALPRTTWAGHIGLLHSQVSQQEVNATLERVMEP